MADLGQAYVQIVPKATGIESKIDALVSGGSDKAGAKAGVGIATGIKKALVAAGIGAAVTGVIKSAVDEGGKLQQSYGGLETIYGDAAGAAKQYAVEAAKAGISANDYAEQAVSFGASLKQAFAGDTTKAVEAANTAIMDMTDNAAKMGTPIENIQNAYQGFAKQNYTMLDNLKLGYGGTKSEMERLLSDASKLSGVEYNIDNLGDVYDAIHVIQGDLGLTGVAAQEASETFSGSFGAMKASLDNLMGAMALGEGVGPAMQTLAQNASTFLFDNLIPMIGTVISSIPDAIGTFMETGAPALVEKGKALLDGLIKGIADNAPLVVEALPGVFDSIGNAITTYAPMLLTKGAELLGGLVNGIITYAPDVLNAVWDAVVAAFEFVATNLPELGNMIIDAASNIPGPVGDVATKIGEVFNDVFPKIQALVQAVWPYIQDIITTAVNVIKTVVPPVFNKIRSIVSSVMNAVRSIISKVWPVVSNIVITAVALIKSNIDRLKVIVSTVKSIFNSVKEAITGPINKAKELIKTAIDQIKQIFSGLSLKLPEFKLPHFSISGGKAPYGIGGAGTPPSFKVNWYAKGAVFDGASLIGVGEAGPEAVVPLTGNQMMPFAKAIANEMGGSGITNNWYITVDGAENPEQWADRMVRQLQLRTRMA